MSSTNGNGSDDDATSDSSSHSESDTENRKASARTTAGLSAEPSLWLRVENALGLLSDPTVLLYRSHGGSDWLKVKGRVVEANHIEDVDSQEEDEDRSLWENVYATFRRFESDEIPGARIRASYRGGEWEIVSDEEGYFSFRIEPEEELEPGWHEVPLQVEVPLTGDELEVEAPVLVPSPEAALGIFSDLDDTVLETDSTDTLSQIRLIFGESAASRPPLPGVGALYRALEKAGPGDAPNPFFYVSLSGWNLYDIFEDFMRIRDLPLGPFFMQDLAVFEDDSELISHDAPKLEQAAILLENYPEMELILIGDSGQEDTENYRRIVERHPGRIRAVYIRDVTPGDDTERDEHVRAVAKEVRAKGVPMILAEDSIAMAEHARDELGIIDDDAVEKVRRKVKKAREEE
jgi:phosphatidate phosphatase APP1